MKYQIIRTDKFNDQLSEIANYIADDSHSVHIALKWLDKIEEAVMKLVDYPNIGNYPRYSILKKQGYRVLIVEKHLIFYKVNEIQKTVILYVIVDGRREYKNLI